MKENPRLFILEDDAAMQSLLIDVINREGWAVGSSSRTENVVSAMRQFNPDLILLDVSLPDGNGFDVCRQLRQDPQLSKTPVIFMTSKGDIKNRLRGFEAGAQDYLTKPFDIREFIARVCAHLAIKREKDKIVHENEELMIRERLRDDLMGMIVHDLRSPLSTIKATLEVVGIKGLLKREDHDIALKNAELAAEWAILMVNDLLDLNTGRLQVVYKPLDLNAVTTRIHQLFKQQLDLRHISLDLDIPPSPPKVETDTILVMRILINLLSNAVKFSPSRSKIRVKAELTSERLAIQVADQGPGIPEAEKEKIFLKYYRVSMPQTRMTVGNGIGLAFCKLAAETLGGRIWVENLPSGGSRFNLEIPVVVQVAV